MKFPKWSIKYIVLAFILLLISTSLNCLGGHLVWVYDIPHILYLSSLITAVLGFIILVLLIGYLMGADYALKTQHPTEEKQNE